jgi:hypothetical protein
MMILTMMMTAMIAEVITEDSVNGAGAAVEIVVII